MIVMKMEKYMYLSDTHQYTKDFPTFFGPSSPEERHKHFILDVKRGVCGIFTDFYS